MADDSTSNKKERAKNKPKRGEKMASKSGGNIDIHRIIATNSHFIKLPKGGK